VSQTAAISSISQNADIRFLGKLLGDVIRAYGGDALFQRIEDIRVKSVERYRGIVTSDVVDRGLDGMTLDEMVAVVRGFMLFSMLANLAEDRQSLGRHLDDNLGNVLERLSGQGHSVEESAKLLDGALVAPVLTAHPTEVMRKSMLDHRNRIAQLLKLRDAGKHETPDGDLLEPAIVRQIALLWQTRALRRDRLYVTDEVESALAYMREVFLPVLPALYGAAASASELSAAGQLDRWRSRRQSECDGRVAGASAAAGGRDGAGVVSDAGRCAGGRAVDFE
jgi:phosphoenolpyruvate carboxylase